MIPIFVILCVMACSFCAGFCAGAVLPRQAKAAKHITEKPVQERRMNEDQERELRRRQRELMNFFNYNGDAMPAADEESGLTPGGNAAAEK